MFKITMKMEENIKQILIKNNNTLSLEKLVILNFIKQIENPELSEITLYYEETLTPHSPPLSSELSALVLEGYVMREGGNYYKLAKLGIDYFKEGELLDSDTYSKVSSLLSIWNSSPHTTTHRIQPEGELQNKTIQKIAEMVYCLENGIAGDILRGVRINGEPLAAIPTIPFDGILSTLEKSLQVFEDGYYPKYKDKLPTALPNFLCFYKTKHSWFLKVYYEGVTPLKNEILSDLSDKGITVPTLKLAYETLLSPEKRVEENEKLKVVNKITQLHTQWEELVKYLSDYYSWNQNYRNSLCNFNTFTFTFLSWMSREIGGERFPPYLSMNTGNRVYEQFRAYYADKYGIRFNVPRKLRENLRNKNKIYLGEK